MNRWNDWFRDASGSVADLGVLAPITAALVVGNGLDVATVLVGVGSLYVLAGWYFKVPVPVQPIKAAAAIAIARELDPETLATAGILLGAVLLLLGATGAVDWIARVFTVPVIRGLQLGVGLILFKTAIDLASPNLQTTPLVLAGAIAVVLLVAGREHRRYPVAIGLVVGSVVVATIGGAGLPSFEVGLWSPQLNAGALDLSVIGSAFVLLVVPQIPLTLGNAVVAVVDLEHRYFPDASSKMNPRSVSLSCGIANVTVGVLAGMPLCHGSGGLTAHYRAGARTWRMNLIIGVFLLILGLFLGPTALGMLALIPAPVLAGFLAFTGLFHASLALSLRGADLLVAVVMGVLGVVTTNLAIALGVGLALHWGLLRLNRPADLAALQS